MKVTRQQDQQITQALCEITKPDTLSTQDVWLIVQHAADPLDWLNRPDTYERMKFKAIMDEHPDYVRAVAARVGEIMGTDVSAITQALTHEPTQSEQGGTDGNDAVSGEG